MNPGDNRYVVRLSFFRKVQIVARYSYEDCGHLHFTDFSSCDVAVFAPGKWKSYELVERKQFYDSGTLVLAKRLLEELLGRDIHNITVNQGLIALYKEVVRLRGNGK